LHGQLLRVDDRTHGAWKSIQELFTRKHESKLFTQDGTHGVQ